MIGNESFKAAVKKNKKSHETLIKINRFSKKAQKPKIIPKLKSLRVLKKLGEGEFGVVFLVGDVESS